MQTISDGPLAATSPTTLVDGSGGATRELRFREVVAVVDDDAELRLVTTAILEDAGFDVVECQDLAAAFAFLRGAVPDFVVLDRDLPDGSGLEVARWLRRWPRYDGVRVVAFSGRNSAGDVDAALAAGCDAFVGKPCTTIALVDALRGRATPTPGRRAG